MKARELKLEGEGGDLLISADERGWARCRLLAGSMDIFLGAEDLRTLASRLISRLGNERGAPAGEIGGHCVRWVASLEEAHHSLYFYIEDGVRVLFWQDAKARPVRTVKLSGEQYRKWREQLAAVVGDVGET